MIKSKAPKKLFGIIDLPVFDNNFLRRVIELDADDKVVKFISEQVDLTKEETVLLLSSNKIAYTDQHSNQIRAVIDLRVVNHQKELNAHFQSVNEKLPDAGIYIGCVETNTERKRRIFSKHPRSIAKIMWNTDFVIHRVLPKLSLTKNIYSFIFRKKYHAVSKAEILGRLSHAGFEVIGHEVVKGFLYFSVIKTSEPKNDKKASYGILFKMNRVGKGGKTIGVYKVRTMHPYSEYIQDYVVRLNGYNKAGKPNRDFRLTKWGRIIRKLHLDEMPQLLNVLKGELNLIGVRPLSKFGFSSLPIDLQEDRIKFKPGCIPPNIALGLKGFEGVIRAERIYLREMKKNRYTTNLKYFWMSISNLIRGRHISA